MGAGVGFALMAGLMWGLVFVGPLLLPEYSPLLHTLGRYMAFGLITLPLAWWDRSELRRLTRADWVEALKLVAVGNFLYYLLLASAIQRAGAPLPTMIIGTLPVVIAIAANLRNRARDGHLPWRRLAPALVVILTGIACVNQMEMESLAHSSSGERSRYLWGAGLAVGAVACWTWYPLRNGDWMRAHPERNARAWATAQGLATLPLALLGSALHLAWLLASAPAVTNVELLGPRPLTFAGLMIAIGLLSSWLATLCWNAASQRLSTALAGQLIVFETLAALLYAFLLRGTWPGGFTWLGIGLLVTGVVAAVRIRPEAPT
jgi:drug/metabolite transporter (DMT)-like permease